VSVSDVSVTAAVPVFLTVTTCAADVDPTVVDENVKADGERASVSVEALVPVPDNATICGEPAALSVASRLAVSVPTATGLNATDSVQLAPAARVVPQVFADRTKLLASVPLNL
jgi:hypothetical protein